MSSVAELKQGDSVAVQLRPRLVSVSATRTSDTGSHTLYVLLVKWDAQTSWTVARRFNDFVTLRTKLSEYIQDLPALPAKTWLRSFAPDFVAKRKHSLHLWINEIMNIPAVAASKEVYTFLQLDVNVPTLSQFTQPLEIKTLCDQQFGINEFHYDEKEMVLFSVCEDVSTMSRWDTKLSNTKLPWEKPGGCIVPLGSFNCFRLDASAEWKATCTLYFDCAVTCVAWEPKRRYVMLGLENGHIVFYAVDADYQEFNLVREFTGVHTDRVTGLVYDPERDILVSISRDKNINVYSMQRETHLCHGSVSQSWLSALSYDTVKNVAYVGCYGAKVLIVNLSESLPVVVHSMGGHDGSVRALDYRAKDGYLFSGAFDAKCGIFSIPLNKDLPRARSVGWLKGGPKHKVKSVHYCDSIHQVAVGYDNGVVAFFDTASALIQLVWKAHESSVVCLKWIAAPSVLMSGSHDGKIKFWKMPDVADASNAPQPVSSFPEESKRPDSLLLLLLLLLLLPLLLPLPLLPLPLLPLMRTNTLSRLLTLV